MPLGQRDTQLAAGEVRPEAAMDPAAEREVAIDLPVEAHIERIGKLFGVDVG